MKLKNLLMAGLPLAMALASCSSDEPSKTGVENNTFIGDGYMSISIAMPQTPGTRAENDNFAEGTSNEYNVKNAAIALFTGDPDQAETTYTFVGAYVLPTGLTGGDVTVDRRLQATFKVDNIEVPSGKKMFALAMVNYVGRVTLSGSDMSLGTITSMKTGGTENAALTFGDMLKQTSNNDFYTSGTGADATKDNFFMMNAVMSNIAGGSQAALEGQNPSYFTLVKCNDNCIYDNQGEAELHPACTINVERAVAKATLSYSTGTGNIAIVSGDEVSNETLEIASVQWILDNTEDNSYFVRNMGLNASENKIADNVKAWFGYYNTDNTTLSTQKYRFVGALYPDNYQETARTYWCIDPQYTSEAIGKSTLSEDGISVSWGSTGDNAPQYCHENTFDINQQTWKNTTRAVLKVTYKVKVGTEDATTKTLYVTNGNDHVFFSDENKTGIKSTFLENADLMEAYQKYAGTGDHNMGTDFTFVYQIVNGIQKIKSINVSTNIDGAATATTVELYKAAEEGGNATYGELKRTPDGGTETTYFTSTQVQDLVSTVENAINVKAYENGVAYYQVRIKHFGNDLCPWNTTTNPVNLPSGGLSAYTISDAYGSTNAAQNFLGRYGMVRNNWYDVNIEQFKTMGDNTFPTVSDKDTPDDVPDNEHFMKVRINILSWAKRTQNEKL